MKYTKFFRQTSLAFTGVTALAVLSGCQTHEKPVAYYSSGNYMAAGSTGSAYGTSASSPASANMASTEGQQANQTVIPLHQETVQVGTREVDAGAVRIRKIIKTETVNQPVQVRQESLVVDRVQGDAAAQAGQPASSNLAQQGGVTTPFQEGEIVIRLKREEPVVQTQTVPAGSVVAQTKFNTDQVNIQRQVRREDVEVIKEGNPQNVTISENLRASATQPSAGAGGSLSGTTEGSAASSSGTITDLSQLTGGGDKSAFAGRTVQIPNAKVQSVSSDHTLFAVGTDQNSRVWVHTTQAAEDLKEGDAVQLNGVVQTPAQSQSSFNESTSQQLKSEPIYIEAKSVQKATQ